MDDIDRAARCARAYRAMGYNVLPSRRDRKGPALPEYKKYWKEPCPVELYEKNATGNIQIVCGAMWRLAVLDLDGAIAIKAFEEMSEGKPVPETWIVENGSNDGRHLYFTIPCGVTEVKSRDVWGLWELPANKWRRRAKIEILGDSKLVMAPPSVHPDHGGRYHFVEGRSPKEIPVPAEMPAWMLLLPGIEEPNKKQEHVASIQPIRVAPGANQGQWLTTAQVIDMIPDKVSMAVSWGLKLETGKPNQDGWVRCYRAGSNEGNASAGISVKTGQYWEDGQRQVSLFDLGVKLGRYATWQDAKRDIEKGRA